MTLSPWALWKIKEIKGVSSVKRRLWGYYYDPVAGADYTVIVPEDDRSPPGR
jgi:hypothetical protein